MRQVTIAVSDAQFGELLAEAALVKQRGYGPEDWAADVVAAELAARRLPRVAMGRNGGRLPSGHDLEEYSLRLPDGAQRL